MGGGGNAWGCLCCPPHDLTWLALPHPPLLATCLLMVLPWGLTALCPSVASIQFTSLLCSPPTRLIFFAELAIWWRTSSVDNCLYFWRLLIFFLFCVHCFFYFFIGVLKCCHHNSINTGQNWQTISQANFYHLKKKVILTLIFWVRLQVKWFVIFPEPLCFLPAEGFHVNWS